MVYKHCVWSRSAGANEPTSIRTTLNTSYFPNLYQSVIDLCCSHIIQSIHCQILRLTECTTVQAALQQDRVFDVRRQGVTLRMTVEVWKHDAGTLIKQTFTIASATGALINNITTIKKVILDHTINHRTSNTQSTTVQQ